MQITLSTQQKKILVSHAESERPNESCALLFGKTNHNVVITDILLTENINKSPTSFAISNEQLIRAYQDAEDKKTNIVGIFHSHPNSAAFPSETDKKFMNSNPVVWLIYSGVDMNIRAFTLDSNIHEIMIRIV